jgi:hypothetical protein
VSVSVSVHVSVHVYVHVYVHVHVHVVHGGQSFQTSTRTTTFVCIRVPSVHSR